MSTTTTSQQYRIGVIGAGARGETFARQLYTGLGRATLFGVCDIDGERLKNFCEYCGLTDTPQFTNPQKFLTHPELDAVIVTTPEFTHKEVAVEAMKAGKHIYLEKAMAHTAEDCRQIIRVHRESKVTGYLGFNLRANPAYQKLHDVVGSGMLGRIMHISGLEQLHFAHGAAFMRRFHRFSKYSGGLLNTKCAHDLDILQWVIGHQHKVKRVVSFGSSVVFNSRKPPAKYCHECPRDIYRGCPYKDTGGFSFPVKASQPIYRSSPNELYPSDLCVYNEEKDIVDNQTLIMEWENGVTGNFNMQLFQADGRRQTSVWGENGYAEFNSADGGTVRVIVSNGEATEHKFAKRSGGHAGTDPRMLQRFLDAIESNEDPDSGLSAGLAATLLAVKADESRLTGRIIDIASQEYL